MTNHTFTLILSGVAELTPELADALYEATHGDIELSLRNGDAFVEFDRTANSLQEAVDSAIRQVEEVGVRVLRVEGALDSVGVGTDTMEFSRYDQVPANVQQIVKNAKLAVDEDE